LKKAPQKLYILLFTGDVAFLKKSSAKNFIFCSTRYAPCAGGLAFEVEGVSGGAVILWFFEFVALFRASLPTHGRLAGE